MSKSYGENLRKLRKNRGVSAEEIGSLLNITFSGYLKYERGEREPNINMLIKLSSFYNVSIDTLLGTNINVNDEDVWINEIIVADEKKKSAIRTIWNEIKNL